MKKSDTPYTHTVEYASLSLRPTPFLSDACEKVENVKEEKTIIRVACTALLSIAVAGGVVTGKRK